MRSLCAVVVPALLAASQAGAFSIVIDPGHGGADPGAVGCGLQEHEINLDVSARLKVLLEQNGQQVFMTRSTNVAVGLQARADFANSRGANRFASIHSNAFGDPSANGTETFCHTSGGTSIDMRDRIQSEMIQAWGLTNRGGKTADFAVLRETVMPATLSELGFVSNCAVDATFLASNARRGEAAEAHLEGIAGHLGFAIGAPPAAQTGELKGVAFKDVGVGTADMTTRIPGAVVRVVGRDDTDTAEGDSAAWTMALPPGTYSIRATAPGFVAGERSCDALDAGGVRFCSIGLVAEAPPPPPPVGEGEGEGEGEEGEGEGGVGEGEGEEGEGEPIGGEGEGEVPGEEGEGEGGAGVTRVVIRNKPGAAGGCSCTQGSDVGASAVALVLLGLLRRRRRASVKPTLALIAIAASVSASSASAFTVESVRPVKVEGSKRALLDETVVTQGVIASVTPSPSGQQLLMSDDHYEGLTVLDVKSGKQTVLSTDERAGFRAVWVDEARVAHRVPQAPFGGQPLIELDIETGAFRGPHFEHARQAVVQDDADAIVLGTRLDESGRLKDTRVLSPADDQCFAPQLRGRQNGDVVVAFQCLVSGLWVSVVPAHGDPMTFRFGQGAQPSLSHDATALVYAVAADEGHVIVEADVVVVDLSGTAPVAEVFQTARIERAPGISDRRADGSRVLAWVTDLDVVTAVLK